MYKNKKDDKLLNWNKLAKAIIFGFILTGMGFLYDFSHGFKSDFWYLGYNVIVFTFLYIEFLAVKYMIKGKV